MGRGWAIAYGTALPMNGANLRCRDLLLLEMRGPKIFVSGKAAFSLDAEGVAALREATEHYLRAYIPVHEFTYALRFGQPSRTERQPGTG